MFRLSMSSIAAQCIYVTVLLLAVCAPFPSAVASGEDPLLERRDVQHTVVPLQRLTLEELRSDPESDFARGLKPFILTGAFTGQSSGLSKIINEGWLLQQFENDTVDYYSEYMAEVSVHPTLVPMRDAFDRTDHLLATTIPLTKEVHIDNGPYLQWNIKTKPWDVLRRELDIPVGRFTVEEDLLEMCLPQEELRDEFMLKTHWRMMILGRRGAGMFNHADVIDSSSYQVQLIGAKRWHICGPDQLPYLYGPAEVNVFDPDYDKYPLFRKARCYEGVVYAGETITYPMRYWHSTRNLRTPSVALSSTIIDGHNYQELTARLQEVCTYNEFTYFFSRSLCAALDGCYDLWHEIFGADGAAAAKGVPRVKDSKVLQLSKKAFTEIVLQSKENWIFFIEFCGESCQNRLGNEYKDKRDRLARMIEPKHLSIGVVTCERGLSESLCGELQVHSHPATMVYWNGRVISKYDGYSVLRAVKKHATTELQRPDLDPLWQGYFRHALKSAQQLSSIRVADDVSSSRKSEVDAGTDVLVSDEETASGVFRENAQGPAGDLDVLAELETDTGSQASSSAHGELTVDDVLAFISNLPSDTDLSSLGKTVDAHERRRSELEVAAVQSVVRKIELSPPEWDWTPVEDAIRRRQQPFDASCNDGS